MDTEYNYKLFKNDNSSGAIFSMDKKHRFQLWRIWDDTLPKITLVGLNPSTADDKQDDPTIRRIISLLKSNGYGGMIMCNCFSQVTPYPKELILTDERRNNENEQYIFDAYNRTGNIAFVWGNFKEVKKIAERLSFVYKSKALCFGKNANGSPKHPLYLKADTKLIEF